MGPKFGVRDDLLMKHRYETRNENNLVNVVVVVVVVTVVVVVVGYSGRQSP